MSRVVTATVRRIGAALATAPWPAPPAAWLPFALFACVAPVAGLVWGLVEPGVIEARRLALMPFALLVFPTLPEEIVFRGVLIPRDVAVAGTGPTLRAIASSTVLFVAWHPLNALAFNPGARALFLDPHFLVLVTGLGLACGAGYAYTRSLWAPIAMHWLTLVVWVGFLGGRNLVLGV